MKGGVPPVPLMPYSCQPVPADGPDAALAKKASEGKDEKWERKENRKRKQKEEFDFG